MLTPAQHERIRRQIVLLPAYVWLVFGWLLYGSVVYGWMVPGTGASSVRDFAHFYVQGVIANQHDARALYDINAQGAILKQVVPGSPETLYPPVHGPQVALFFAPLARLPYISALALWLALTVVTYAACGIAFWRACPRLRDRAWMVFVLLLAAPALRFALSFSQTSAIGLALFTVAYFALRSDRRFLAGLAIGSLAYKPPLGIAAAVAFVGAGEWPVVAGAVVAAAAQQVIGALYWGPHIFVDYFGALTRLPQFTGQMEITFQMHSWRSFFTLLGLPPAFATAAYVAAASATLAAALVCWRSKGPLDLRYSALLVATVLSNPHMYAYDLIILMPAFMLLWNWSLGRTWSFSRSFDGLLYFCYFSPLFGVLATVIKVQLSVLSLVLVGLVVTVSLTRRPAPVFADGGHRLTISC